YVDRAAAEQNLGTVRLEQGRLDDARQSFERALTLDIDELTGRQLRCNLANMALRAQDPARAEQLLAEETARPDALSEGLFLRAKALHLLGREAESAALIARLRLQLK